jgi:hypothetical protein
MSDNQDSKSVNYAYLKKKTTMDDISLERYSNDKTKNKFLLLSLARNNISGI